MVFDNRVQSQLCAVFAQPGQTIRGALLLFLETARVARGRVDADAVAAKELCRVGPLVMIGHGLLPAFFRWIAQVAFAIAHNEHAPDSFAFADSLEFLEVGLVPRL